MNADKKQTERIESYWFSLKSTGVTEVDEILRAMAQAGSKYHHTDGWDEEDIDGNSEILKIQRAAEEAAHSFVRLRKEIVSLRINLRLSTLQMEKAIDAIREIKEAREALEGR